MNQTQGSWDDSGAIFSECGLYRYALWRCWNTNLDKVMFIGLNPSTANAIIDDPTSRRLIYFAKKFGYGGYFLGNLFSWCSKNPKELNTIEDPIGSENDHWLNILSLKSTIRIAIWGDQGTLHHRYKSIYNRFRPLHCLGFTKSGQPKHPLYLPRDSAIYIFHHPEL